MKERLRAGFFRRFSYISAFGEGWGLYSEWLGLEAGFCSTGPCLSPCSSG